MMLRSNTLLRRLLFIWLSFAAVSITLGWLIFELSRQGADEQIRRERQLTADEAQRFPMGIPSRPISAAELPSSSSLTEPAKVIAIDGISLAHDSNGKAVLWGPQVTDSPQRFRLPEGTSQVRLGPTGLMAAW